MNQPTELDDDGLEPESANELLCDIEAEVEVSPELEFLEDVTQIYLNEIGEKSLLTPEEELLTARLVKQGDFAARQRMIEHNLRLVVNIAKHYLNRGIPLLDLIEEGNLGLIHALEKFDPERGFRFSTYATWWIRQYIERAIMNHSRTVRLPVHVVKEINLVLRAIRHLETTEGKMVSIRHLAALMDKPEEEIRHVLSLNEHTTSLDAPLDIDPNHTIADFIVDENNNNPETTLESHEVASLVRTWLVQLGERQREVIERRYGFNGQDISTLDCIAKELNLTRERVRQIQLEGLKSLRRILQRGKITRDSLL